MAEEQHAVRRVILVAPLEYPIEFRVEPDDLKFPNMIIMSAYLGNKMLARKASQKPPPEVEKEVRLKGRSRLPDVRPLVYTGIEEEIGGHVKALLAIPMHPVKYEDLPDGGMSPDLIGPCRALGMNIRPKEDRTFPNDLIKECCAHLDHILEDVGPPEPIIEVPRILTLNPNNGRRPHGPLKCIHNIPWRDCKICRSTLPST